MPSTTPSNHSGRLLEGKYRLQRLLGRGGMGEVYEASHELIGRKLAIKVLHNEFLADDETVRRFEREARVATAIGHEHIVEITDMGRTEQGELFIAMEYLEGTDLAAVLEREQRLDVRRSCHIAIQVLSALEAAHAKGIVHRDLKPANIFLVSRGGTTDYVKIVDFGISKVRDPRGTLASGHTRAGELLGTPLYMSPEQALGSTDITPATDIFSLGVVMYEMLSATLPFRAPSLPKLLHKIIREEPEPLGNLVPELPADLVHVVATAMAKRPEERFRSASEMRRALRKFSPETSLVAGLRTTRISSRVALMQEVLRERGSMVAPEPEAKRKRPWIVVLGAVGTAMLGTMLWWWFGGQDSVSSSQKAAVEVVGSRPKDALAAVAASPKTPVPTSGAGEEPAVVRAGELTVMVDPPDAEIVIDEVSIGQGAKERFPIPLDRKEHSVLVRRKGYADYQRSLLFESSLHLTVTLEPLPGTEVQRDKPRPQRPQQAERRTSPSETAPENKAAGPGSTGRTKRVIDENTPW